MRLVWVVIPLVLIVIVGMQESFAQEWGYGESNVIEVQGIDYKISAEYSPDTVTHDGYEEGILSLRVFDRNSNQTARDVTLRVEILKDDVTLAKNIYFTPDGTIKITIQPNSKCAEEQISQCTTYSRTYNDIAGYTYTADPEPTITGPVFDKPGIYKIKMIIEALIFEDKILVEPLDFELLLKLGGDTYLSENYKVHDRRIQGLMEYNIPYEMDNGKITGVHVTCNGATMRATLDNTVSTQLVMSIPKSMINPDAFYPSGELLIVEHDGDNNFQIISSNPEFVTVQFDVSEINASVGIDFSRSNLVGSWVSANCPFDRLYVTEQPPDIQIKAGVDIEKLRCFGGLSKIFKVLDGSPACVKPGHKAKLIERGWAINEHIAPLNSVYNFQTQNGVIPIKYNLETGKLSEIIKVKDSYNIEILIENPVSEILTIAIPNNLASSLTCNSPKALVTISNYDKRIVTPDYMIFEILLDSERTKVEILGQDDFYCTGGERNISGK